MFERSRRGARCCCALGCRRAGAAAPGVSVSAVSSLKAGATAGTLTGKVVNDTGKATRADVTVRISAPRHEARASSAARRSRSPRTARRRLQRQRQAAGRPDARATTTSPPARPTAPARPLGCATAQDDVLIKGGIAVPARALARAPRRPPTAAPAGARCPSPARALYPETGNTRLQSLHTDINLVYDAPTNLFLPGTHVDLQQRATQCLTDFSLDFERTNTYQRDGRART